MRRSACLVILLYVRLLTTARLPVAAQGNNPKLKTLVEGNNRFAFKLYHTLGDGSQDNLIYSPYSISEAFAMVYAGAHGTTEQIMRTVLEYSLPQTDVATAFKLLNDDIVARGNHKTAANNSSDLPRLLRIANGTWIEKSLSVKQAYQDQMKAIYQAALALADFRHSPEAERDKINAWVEEQTNDRIKNIIPAGALTAATRMVLANAIYFMNSWQFPFGERSTRPGPFTLIDGKTVQVPMMVQDRPTGRSYVRDGDVELIELPYVGAGMSMVIVLPAQGKFADVEKSLDAGNFSALISKLDSTNTQVVRVLMPRYKFEYSQDLTQTLRTLGMEEAFSANADFTGISDEPLAISKALHKAFIAVDEKGTEAAAATVVMMTTSALLSPPPVLDVKIDRPFVFFIRDQQTNSILFMGRVTRPVEGK